MDWYNVLYLAIGAILTLVGTIITQCLISKNDEKKFLREKREKDANDIKVKKEALFLEIVDVMTMVVAESKLSNETGERVNNLKSKLYLYLDGEWFDKTFDLICEILDKKLDKNYKPKEEMEKYILELKHFLFNN